MPSDRKRDTEIGSLLLYITLKLVQKPNIINVNMSAVRLLQHYFTPVGTDKLITGLSISTNASFSLLLINRSNIYYYCFIAPLATNFRNFHHPFLSRGFWLVWILINYYYLLYACILFIIIEI